MLIILCAVGRIMLYKLPKWQKKHQNLNGVHPQPKPESAEGSVQSHGRDYIKCWKLEARV